VSSYIPLWCKSNFSFLEGASHPEELVEQADALGLGSLAITDRDGVYGVVRAHVRARELGVHMILGSEVTIDGGARLILLAQDRRGYGNLCQLLTRGRRRCAKGESLVFESEVSKHAPGLIALWFGIGSPDPWKEVFEDRLYALAARHRRAEEVEDEAALRKQAERLEIPVAAAVEVLYHTKARRPLQDVLTCIRNGVTLHDAGSRTRPNAEHDLKAPSAFHDLFRDDPAAVSRTREIAERCTFSLADIRYRYPSERLPDGTTSDQWLRQLTFEGARQRYGDSVPEKVIRQLHKELDLICELDYPGYFLTMWEIVEFCRREGILCQGRGSAANSAVCYCLGITAVDPTRIDLLFERFLSRERREPPDIDLDISHERREEVIQHVYQKYGRSHAAMVANVIRYRTRSAVREVGKVLGLPQTGIDRLAKLAFRHDGDFESMLHHAGFDPQASMHQHLVRLVNEIQDFPRHLSIHPGGFLLGHEPVDTLVPIENGTMADRTVIQWDKDDLEELGLFKVDCLGLGALTLCDEAFELLRQHRGIELDLATIPEEDPATYEMCCRADTVGVFQIESRAQMAMLPRLRPKTFYDLVIEISIVRPGPIAGDMVHPFLRRRHGEEEVSYAHPCLVPVLGKTLGVPLFQEQVMKLAVVAADYTPGEADQLRRDMAAWRRSGRIERHRERLISRMRKKGIEQEFAQRVFEQIRGFGEYGFPESHAASFALIAYATAWLKCHHPDVFVCALLNAQPMGFYSPATIVEDAKHHGIEMRSVNVLCSGWDCTLEGRAVRMGLRYVKGLPEDVGRALAEAARQEPFSDLEGFVRRGQRCGLNKRHLTVLAEGGALEELCGHRREALWEVWELVNKSRNGLPLLEGHPTPVLPELDAFETIAWDYQAGDHSARGHPLGPLRPALQQQCLVDAETVRGLQDGSFVRCAGLVICRQRPATAKGVVFMTLQDETGFVNVVIWQKVFERFAPILKTEPFVGVSGKLQRQHDVVHVIARRIWVPRLEALPQNGGSRDFH